MSIETESYENLREGERNLYLASLLKLRTECVNRQVTLHPCSRDYQKIGEMIDFIDKHQLEWTGDPQHFKIKPIVSR